MSKEPEIGQMAFGNPTGEYGTESFADALVNGLLDEIERVYWNVNQEEWNRPSDPKIPGLQCRAYDWSEDEKTVGLPNLKFDFSPQEIRWYKHPGRGQSCSLQWTAEEWKNWYDQALDVICKADTPNL